MPKFLIYAGPKDRASYQYTIECKSKEEALKIAHEEAKRQYQLNCLTAVIPKRTNQNTTLIPFIKQRNNLRSKRVTQYDRNQTG